MDEDIEGLCLGARLGLVCLNREVNDRGFSHGGLAVAFKAFEINLKKVKLHNPKSYEVLMVSGMITSCLLHSPQVFCTQG